MSRHSRSHKRRSQAEEVELNITPFMNLMIVLVPVLLLSMVFTHVRVHDIQLPELSQRISDSTETKQLELLITDSGFELFYPAGESLKRFPANGSLPFGELQQYLRLVKATFQEKAIDKSEITLLPAPDTNYQTLIQTLDAVKFVPETVTSETTGPEAVLAALFPNVSLGNAPE